MQTGSPGDGLSPCGRRAGRGRDALLVLLLTAVVAVGGPAWTTDPKTEDSLYLYSLGYASEASSAEAAEKAAYRDALLRILKTHRSDIDDPDRWPMQKVAVVPGCIHSEQGKGGYSCWIQIMWPKSERANLMEQLTTADLAEEKWQQARSLTAEGRPAEGRVIFETLFAEQTETPISIHSAVEMQYEIARSWHIENRPLEARRWYERIIAQTPDDPLAQKAAEFLQQLPPPPRLWPLNARFDGGPVALVAAIREGADWRPYRELTRTLSQELRDAGLETVDRAKALDKAVLQDVLEEGVSMLDGVDAPTAKITLLASVEIDPSRKGATTTAFGASLPVPDTRVMVRMVDVAQGDVLYEESFPATSGTRSAANLAEHVSHILISNHLLPHCPGLKRTLLGDAVHSNPSTGSDFTHE